METNKIKYNIIQQYLEGKLDPKDMHELEKQALEDPFLAEAIEGYSAADPSAGKNLSLLQRQLEERVARQQENKNLFYFTWQRLSVAAAAGLLFISAGILFWMKGHRSGDHVARQKHVEVKLTPADSLGLDRSTPVVPERIDTTIAAEIEVGTMGTLGERSRIKKQEALLNDGNRAISVLPQAAKDSLRRSLGAGPATLAASQESVDKMAASVAGDDTLKSFAGRSRLNTALPGVSNAHSKSTISGKVVSMDDGRPLSDVSVKSERSGISVLTNHEGEFVLPDSTGGNVAFAADGFESQIRNAEAGTQLSVRMKPVKKGAATSASPAQKLLRPEPVTGWTKYKTYLKENIRLPGASRLNGNVVLRFKVNSSGILSNFTVEKGLNEACNKEAIRLVEEGPAWRPSTVKEEEEVRLSILFSK